MSHKDAFTTSEGGARRSAASASLAALVRDYIEQVEIDGRAAITARRYHDYLETFLQWLAATTAGRDSAALTTTDITPERLRQYRLYLARRRDPQSGQVIGAATRNLYQIALRQFLGYCRRKRDLEVPDPETTLELAKERDLEIRRLERPEVERVAAAIRLDEPNGLRDRAVVETLFGTGCRVSELVGMTRRQVNLERREAEVVGKGGRARLVLFTKQSAGWLKRYLATRDDESPYLFVSRRRSDDGTPSPLSVRQVQRIVDEASRRAGLPFRVSPHWFRHGRLSLVARFSGVQVAQRIAGHSSLATTARYLHLGDKVVRSLFDEAEEAGEAEGRSQRD